MDTDIDTDRLSEDHEVENFDTHIPDPPTLTSLTATTATRMDPMGTSSSGYDSFLSVQLHETSP